MSKPIFRSGREANDPSAMRSMNPSIWPTANEPSADGFPIGGFLFRLFLLILLGGVALTHLASTERCLAFAVFVLSIRLSRPFSALNLIALYWLLTFVVIVQPSVEFMSNTLCLHYVILQSIITLSYYIFLLNGDKGRKARYSNTLIVDGSRLQGLWYLTCAIGFVITIVQIAIYGPIAWFSGSVLAETMDRYSSGDPIEAMTRLAFWIVNWSLFALFVIQRESRQRLKGILIGFGFLPILSMARQTFVYDMIFILLTGRRRSAWITAIVVASAALLVGLGIGAARSDRLQQDSGANALIMGEFSSSIVYASLLQNPDAIPLQWGATIVPPILLAPVPRFVFPSKPQNGAGTYMETFEPDALAAGYSYAINCFSDALMNFGFVGELVLALLIGLCFGWVDKSLAKGDASPLQLALVFNIYFLMRMAIAESLTFIILQLFVYSAIKWFLKATAPDVPLRKPQSRQAIRATSVATEPVKA